jgi:uncharacterized integral membrane protein
MKIFYFVLVIVFAIFIVTFSNLNEQNVTIRYYYMKDVDVPLYMLIFAALLLGGIITWFFEVVERFRLGRQIVALNKTVRDLRKELRTFEPPPIIDEK